MPAIAEPFIIRAPRDLGQWVSRFDAAALPVLADTAATIEQLRAVEDEVDAHSLGEAISDDPLMTLKLLAHVAQLRRGREGSDPETVTAALVMLGIPPFFRHFGPQPTVEQRLGALPRSLAGFERVLRRSRRAARFAIAFAAHRVDPDAAVLFEAALLHDFAELLLWLEAPTLALRISERQREQPGTRSAALQRELLNIELADLQHELMARWRLPQLLVQITDDKASVETVQMRSVRLAMRLARHSAQGWDDPALPDDLQEIGALLQLSAPYVEKLLLEIDDEG
jgi:HD-like signal output (HDOD) protein